MDNKKIKVLYDYPSFMHEYGGVPRYICETLKELQNEIEVDMSVLYSNNVYRKQLDFLKNRKSFTKKKFKSRDKIESVINLAYSSLKIIRNKYDIFHATYNNAFTFGVSNASYFKYVKKPFLVTIHDMIYENLPDRDKVTKHLESKKKLIYNSDHIIAVSENTKKEILRFYPINPDKITVIYHGASVVQSTVSKNEFGNYILFVGRRSPYKNFPFFIKAIAPLLLENSSLQLICVSSPFNEDEKMLLNNLGILHQVQTVSVSDDQLNSLYKHSSAFVFPSLDEGFGIPILEAFSNSCPVCLSNTSCFPEIAGDAGIYFDPRNELSIRNAVSEVINNQSLSDELRKRGAERLSLFSWKKTAQQTLEVYKKLMK